MFLSVIVLSFNTLELLKQCIELLEIQLNKNFSSNAEYEIIVVDNGSTDGSADWVKNRRGIVPLLLKENVGFGGGNNKGLTLKSGEYTLLLNSDVLLKDDVDLKNAAAFLAKDKKRGALTIPLKLSDGTLDPANHRGFPTPWNAFCYFSGLEKVSSLFGGYHLTHLDKTTIHEIDCPNAAFFLAKSDVLKQIGGFDEDYFMYGEDIDLCYKMKEAGFSIWYYPKFAAYHIKHQSGLKTTNNSVRSETKKHFYSTMLLFYEKHYKDKYNPFMFQIVKGGIYILKFLAHIRH